jgi:peptidyl-prolyl cis-trans isomerase SurA
MPFLKYLKIALLIVMVFLAKPSWALDDALLAVVNDEAITVKDLQTYLNGIYSQLRIEGRQEQEAREIMKEYETKGIEQLIEDKLVLYAADQAGIQIRPKVVDERVDEIKKKYLSYQDFLEAIKHEGLTVSDIRKKIENQIKGQVVINTEVRSKISVNPQEVTKYFNDHVDEFMLKPRVYLESIFVKSTFGQEAAQKKINEAMGRIRNGEDFKAVAAATSDLPSVGEMTEDALLPEFKKQVDVLPAGGISDIIEVPEGYYILRLEGRAPGARATLMEVKDRIYQRLFEEKFKNRFQEWIAKLHKKAYVEVKE